MSRDRVDFVVFSVNSWDRWHEGGFRTRNARVFDGLRRFEPASRVLHVETFAKSRVFAWSQRRRDLERHTGGSTLPAPWPCAFSRVDDRTAAFQMPRDVLYRWPGVALRWLTQAQRRFGLQDPALVVYDPAAARLFPHVPSRLRVVDCDFDWLEHPDLVRRGRGVLESGYEHVRRGADLVVRVSREPMPVVDGHADQVVIANGYDESLFTPAGRPEPADLAELPRPRAAYVGTVQGRVDLELLRECARQQPEVQWILIGPSWNEDELRASLAENLHWLGAKTHDEIPAYLEHVDVGLIPHHVDALTASMDPLKLYEYLAMGLPTVSTPVSGLDDFDPRCVRVAHDATEFAAAVRKAVGESNDHRDHRRAAVAECSWPKRMNQLHEEIRRRLHAANCAR